MEARQRHEACQATLVGREAAFPLRGLRTFFARRSTKKPTFELECLGDLDGTVLQLELPSLLIKINHHQSTQITFTDASGFFISLLRPAVHSPIVPGVLNVIMGLALTFAQLPFVILFNIITSPFSVRNKHKKSLRRVIGDSTFRFVGRTLTVAEVQAFYGTTFDNYKKWISQNKLLSEVDELGGDSRLLWLGPKRTDRVILWCHGGGLLLAIADYQMYFMRHVQQGLEGRDGKGVGVALLEYTLATKGPFPTQLNQLMSAVKHLLDSGVQPENLVLAGDSAGALLIVQLLSHTLHPLPASPTYQAPPPSPLAKLTKKLSGIFLLSPWIAITGTTGSSMANSITDSVTNEAHSEMGIFVLSQLPQSERHYVEANTAAEGWFQGVNSLVDNMLVTAGEKEILATDISTFVDKLSKEGFHESLERVHYIVQKDGVHDDPILDFFAKEDNPAKMSYVTPLIIDWLADRLLGAA